MSAELLGNVVELARKAGYVYVATADGVGMPHITVAGSLGRGGDDEVVIKEWFCPGTMANLKVNRAVSVAVWDLHCDVGYQLLGELERIDDLAVADGYAPRVEGEEAVPQVEKQLVIHVEKVLDFTLAPHCDVSAEAGATL